MIKIYAYQNGTRRRLFVEGHAGYGAVGADVVCAGVSALVGALVGYALAHKCPYLRYSVAPGRAFLSCREGLDGAFEVVLGGLCEIATQYPAYVRVAEYTRVDNPCGSAEKRCARVNDK